MKKSKKALLSILLCLVLVITGANLMSSSYAGVTDMQNELDDVKDKIDQYSKQFKENESQLSDLATQMASLEAVIYDLQLEIDELQLSIDETKLKISQKLVQLEEKQAEIDQQDEDLKVRLRAMYKNGNTGMLSVILNSTSITNLLDNIEMAKRIYASDKNLLYKMHLEYDAIYEAKVELSNLKDELLAQQSEIQNKQDVLVVEKEELSQKKSALASSNAEIEAQEALLKEKAEELTNTIREMQGYDPYAGGGMTWPCDFNYITSYFGWRYIFGGYSFHTGIDIGAWGGSNIYAANSGTVMYIGWDPTGYGNYVMIDHGGGVVTLYAHSSKILVSQGEYVTRGQRIALVGTTGMSTGNHLHFEIRINGQYQNPLDTSNKYYVEVGVHY